MQLKIRAVRYWKEDMDLTRPYAVTYVMHDSIQNSFIKIEADEGMYGLGAGSPSKHVTGEVIDDNCEDRIPELEELLVGQDIRQIRSIIDACTLKFGDQPALLAALDMALHDLWCKHLGISMGKYLGVVQRPLPTSITIGIKSLEETVEEGIEYRDRDFQIIKLKIGQSIEEDIERTVRLREAIGEDMLIRVDANQGYTVETFTRYLKATASAKVEFYEQPMKPSLVDDMLKLDHETKELCAADEDLHKHSDAIRLLNIGRAFGIYNIKLMKCGGISEALRIADVAKTAAIPLMWGCMDESVISISASLNAALACPATKYLDLDGSFDLAKDIADGGFRLEKGVLYPLLDQPGLGVSLKEL